MSLDLGAIAKGYFADKLLTFFKENGVHSTLIDLGECVNLWTCSKT